MRRSWKRDRDPGRFLVLALLITLTPTHLLHSQTLDLPRTPEPPTIEGPTYVAATLERMEDEITQLGTAERGARSEAERLVLRAMINWRIIAAELLVPGDLAGPDADLSVLFGLRLAHGRHDLDDLLTGTAGAGSAAGAPRADPGPALPIDDEHVLAALDRFNRDAVGLAQTVRTIEVRALDAALPRILAALVDAVSRLEGRETMSHWPSVREVAGTGGSAPDGAPPGSSAPPASPVRPVDAAWFEDSRAVIAEAPIEAESAAIMNEIVGYLERGTRFPELHLLVERYRRRLDDALAFADTVAAAGWLGDADRDACRQRLHEALAVFRRPESRSAGERRLDRLVAFGRIAARITVLDAQRVDVKPIAKAVRAAGLWDAKTVNGDPVSAAYDILPALIDRMIAVRALDRTTITREYRVLAERLERNLVDAERTLLDRLPEILSAGDSPRSDPGMSSLLSDYARTLEDRQRLDRIPRWLETAEAINPQGARSFASQLRRTCQWLADSNRRPDAERALRDLEERLASYASLPYEDALRSDDGVAIVATGGLHADLLVRLEDARREWIATWGRGDDAIAAARRMRLLFQLARTMAESAEVLRLDGDASVLNRWAGWELPSGLLKRAVSDLPNRLKLATVAAVQGQESALQTQLGRIAREAPVAQLVGRLSLLLDDALAPKPKGTLSVLGQMIYPPGPGAWMGTERKAFARFCRSAVEADFAWAQGRTEEAEALQAYVDALAESLVREVGGESGMMPAG